MFAEFWNAVDCDRLNLLFSDEARALELARRILVAGAPEKILVIEAKRTSFQQLLQA